MCAIFSKKFGGFMKNFILSNTFQKPTVLTDFDKTKLNSGKFYHHNKKILLKILYFCAL